MTCRVCNESEITDEHEKQCGRALVARCCAGPRDESDISAWLADAERLTVLAFGTARPDPGWGTDA